MTDAEQLLAIAEACGWRVGHVGEKGLRWYSPHDPSNKYYDAPDYLNDLNAMREAEEMLNPEQRKIYSERLSFLLRDQESRQPFYDLMFVTLHAPAHLRAKAFLQTIKKWKDSEPLNPSESKGTEVTCND